MNLELQPGRGAERPPVPVVPSSGRPAGAAAVFLAGGSWTVPFTASMGLLLLGAGLAFLMRPDRPLEEAA
jgi:hypothetical protein